MKYPKNLELEYVKAIQDAGDNLDMSTEATNAELNEAIIDEFAEFGVKYSKDGRKLLKAPKNFDGTYSIKEGTQIICDRAFIGCKSLRSIVIPDSVTSIGDSAFFGCWFLCSLVIPDGVTSIGDWAFGDCLSLSSIVIPGSVVYLNGNPFCRWNGELKCLSPYFIYDNKVLFNKDKSKIIAFRDKKAKSYAIPDYVTSIGDSAFKCCESLRSIVIPDSVTSIGYCAFFGCTSLKEVAIPSSVTSIGEMAFQYCRSLTDIAIPDSVTSIGNNAFKFCFSLRSIIIPDGVTSIGNNAFGWCKSLSSLVIPEGVTSIGESAFFGCNFPNDLKQELSSRFGDKIFG